MKIQYYIIFSVFLILSSCSDEGEIPTYGCMDESACNYNPSVTNDDDLCEYADDFYDCDDECISDLDGDGVCDELEAPGCTDSDAINYNLDATFDDGSCEYIDCNLDLTGCEVCSPTYPTYVYNDIRDMLIVNNCFLCHNGASNTGLDLSTYQGVMNGGNNGPIITECNPNGSLFITAFDVGGAMCGNDFTFCGLWDDLENLEMIQTWISEGTPE